MVGVGVFPLHITLTYSLYIGDYLYFRPPDLCLETVLREDRTHQELPERNHTNLYKNSAAFYVFSVPLLKLK